VIVSFKDPDTRDLFETGKSRRWPNIVKVAKRKLDQLEISVHLTDLKVPPGNRLEALHGDRKGQFSIRIDAQWRICFVWRDNQAGDVEIVDYH